MISHDFVMALRNCKYPNVIRGIATANSLERAEEFSRSLADYLPNTRGSEKGFTCYGCYDDLLRDENIDCVYIGVLNSAHCDWVCKSLQAGKHVLCEKPLCATVEEAQRMVECARSNRRFLMEGWWSRCFPAYKALCDTVEGGQLGQVRLITASFGSSQLPDNRTNTEIAECPLNDIGTYLIQFALFCMKDKRPSKSKICVHKSPDERVDIAGTVCLEWDGGHTRADLLYSAEVDTTRYACISFDKGVCEFPEFFNCPTRFTKIPSMPKGGLPPRETQHWPLNDTAEYNFENTSGFRYEADHVYECIQQGRLESPLVPWQTSLLLTELTVDLRRQAGVYFPVDKQKMSDE